MWLDPGDITLLRFEIHHAKSKEPHFVFLYTIFFGTINLVPFYLLLST